MCGHSPISLRPPLFATSRDTVEIARPRVAAITVKVSPRTKPALISSRSIIDSRDGEGVQSHNLVSGVGRSAISTPTMIAP